ncbi:LPXTG cell wall anchor domain-containing protein [Myceligenerans pegani]|uniref:LPXTG cell wall anchor domain-containing protein n=1 Tax=Myceligenerans pegani TaxID=2776917 RepID=A0ABR9MV13_9MICO|nr:LPXTG cell wall anchor domain-containing protein [Myceligenerans sp. TRM 65318]MBE1875222.1 LPXTG cell wall anchor domain-containing protein [Myceligenerans sp. TRM 65318]MBE3017493.1 LPXTG cell wall anchor domain-containing protein [Myceligenerans sp. TRM 65318]
MPVGATSAVGDDNGDDYGPDEFLCTISLSDSVVFEGTPVDATVSCAVDTTGLLQLIDEDGGIVDTAELTVAGSGDATMNGAAGDTAAIEPASVAVASADTTAARITTTALHTTNVGTTAAEPAAVRPATQIVAMDDAGGAFLANDDDPATLTMVDLKAGDYTVRFVDPDDGDLANPAAFTVLPIPPGHDGKQPGDDGLAATGATGLPYLAVAGGLLLVGVAALVVTRRARGRA